MVRTLSPLTRWFFRPSIWEEFEEEFPELTMTEGIDMYEEDGKIVVKAAVPGVKPENVEVTFEDGVLRIRAKEEEKEEDKKKRNYYRMDRVVSFDYTVTIPRPVDVSSLEAEVENGVVKVSAKIAEEAKPKKIPVKAKKK